MNFLVAGSKGFIGSNCVRHFSTEHSVWGCDIHEAPAGENYYQLNEKNTFGKILSDRKFDVFINASGAANVALSFENPGLDYQLNVENVRLMLDAILAYSPDCRFINFSSAAVYGNPLTLPISENAAIKPLSPYGKHKAESEELLEYYSREKGLKTCSLRVFSAYGPGLHKQLFWDIFQKSRISKHIVLYGTGNESRDFIFIKDLVKAVEFVCRFAGFDGSRINVASGKEITIREATAEFLAVLGSNFTFGFSGEYKEGDPVNWRADISKLRSLGFSPETIFTDGLIQTANNYLS